MSIFGFGQVCYQVYQLSTRASQQAVGALVNQKLHEFLLYSFCTECTLGSNPRYLFSSLANSISSGPVLGFAFVLGVPLMAYREVVGEPPSSLLGVHKNDHNSRVVHRPPIPWEVLRVPAYSMQFHPQPTPAWFVLQHRDLMLGLRFQLRWRVLLSRSSVIIM